MITDSSFLCATSSQDTLHTPQILPQFESHLFKNEPNTETETETDEVPVQDEPENLTLPTTIKDSVNIPKTFRDEPQHDLKRSQQPIALLPKPSVVYTSLVSDQADPINRDIKISNETVKDKLKNIILSNSVSQLERKGIQLESVPKIIIGAVPLSTSQTNLLFINRTSNKLKLATNDIAQTEVTDVKMNDAASGSSKKRLRSEKPETSSLKTERNRAAARRYR